MAVTRALLAMRRRRLEVAIGMANAPRIRRRRKGVRAWRSKRIRVVIERGRRVRVVD